MTILFQHTQIHEWQTYMGRATGWLSETELQSLLNMLGELGADVEGARKLAADTEPEEKHCVRCHDTYTERMNGWDACCIMHTSCMDESKRVGADKYLYTCRSCGRDEIEIGAGNGMDWLNCDICFQGLHTTDADVVIYDDDNTLTCERKGCPQKHAAPPTS
ncbi:hypothetical protein NM688_g5720 [Phlebia brevispora]|uniref:Uncharacterized protein n=1 Tax=Phlebia brevispora TaxID=194682 RepID=A0ACC1SQM5_9APHY|nr:hypothetical protein NM688_g5720 [Phlebia brevispora]